MSRAPVLVRARGVARRHPDTSAWMLAPTDLEVAAGERLALVGPTGSGKTLILRALALLDPIDRGEILWQDEPIADDQVPAYRSRVLYLQQNPVVVEGTVEHNLRLPFHLRCRHDLSFPRQAAIDLLAAVGRGSEFLAAHSANLSGGELQLVALIRTLLIEPNLLLLDEPSAALDGASTMKLEMLVDHWHRTDPSARAWIWVSHDPAQVERLADRTLHLEYQPR